jgi:PhnB protein
VNPYLVFNGRCREAFAFYADCLGGKIEAMLPHAGTPAEGHVPSEWREKIMHARLTVGEDVIMGSDAPPGHFEPPKGFSVAIQLTDPAEAERVFHRLADGGTVQMPLQQTFWAARFGMLVDRFGTPWMVNCQTTG